MESATAPQHERASNETGERIFSTPRTPAKTEKNKTEETEEGTEKHSVERNGSTPSLTKTPPSISLTKGEGSGTHKSPDYSLWEALKQQNRQKKKLRQQAEPEGHLIERRGAWKEQEQFLAELVDRRVGDPARGHVHFLAHVLVTGLPRRREDSWVPVSYKLMRPIAPDWNAANLHRPLREADLIERKPADRLERRSAEYRVPGWLQEEYLNRSATSVGEAKKGKADLVTGKATTRIEKSSKSGENRNSYPAVIRQAMDVISHGRFNGEAIENHLAAMRIERQIAKQRWEHEGRPEHVESEAYRQFQRWQGRYLNDLRCYQAVLWQRPEETGQPGIYRYRMAYRPQLTGRIGQVRGGLQSCTGEMKEAAYRGIEGVKNFDLASCHPRLMIGFLAEAGLDASWLRSYVGNPNAKTEKARQVGIAVKTWKGAFYALLNGARLPTSTSPHHNQDNEILAALRQETGKLRPDTTLRRLREALGPLVSVLRDWHQHLITDYVSEHAKGSRWGRSLKNDVGMRMYPDEIEDEHEHKARLAAFLLQGREAHFIHTLTGLASSYGFEVISNEHDGLVTIGDIPEAAVEEARQRSGVGRTQLEEKPFC